MQVVEGVVVERFQVCSLTPEMLLILTGRAKAQPA
jgi:hypothetical protein